MIENTYTYTHISTASLSAWLCLLIPLDIVIHSTSTGQALQQQLTRFSAPNWLRGWAGAGAGRRIRSWREDGVSFVIFIAARHALLADVALVGWGAREQRVMQPFVQGGSGRLCLCLGNTPLWFLFDCCRRCRQTAGAISHTHSERGEMAKRGVQGVGAWNGFSVQVENWIYHLNMPKQTQNRARRPRQRLRLLFSHSFK